MGYIVVGVSVGVLLCDVCSHRNTIVNSRLEEYLLQTSREIDKQALKEIKAKEVLFMVSKDIASDAPTYL